MSFNNKFNQANFDYRDSSKVSEYVLNLNKEKLANEKALLISKKWEIISQKILELLKIDSQSELENAIQELESLRNEVILEIEEISNSPLPEQP
jgi:hypothetical protein